jgi:putative membrane protein
VIKKPILSEKERGSIAQAIDEAEQETSGEIVLAVVRSSDIYSGGRWRIAIATALLFALVLYWINPSLDPLYYLIIEIPALWIGYSLSRIPPLLRFALPHSVVQEEVHQRALELFHSNKLSSTHDRTVILIFLSVLEHRLEVVADSGIDAKVQPGVWVDVVEHLSQKIRDETLCDGICHAVKECGDILSKHLPRVDGTKSEPIKRILIED